MRSAKRHRIRLRGPWGAQSITRGGPGRGEEVETADPPRRVRVPCKLSSEFNPRAHKLRFERVFHQPTGLEIGDRVELVITECQGEIEIFLNGAPLPRKDSGDGVHSELTGLLQPSNLLRIELSANESGFDHAIALLGEVAIEIVPSESPR